MTRPKKRSASNANLDHGGLSQPKRQCFSEVTGVGSSDSEPEVDESPQNPNHDLVEVDGSDYASIAPKVQPHGPLSLIEQLHLDAFDDLKADLCFELDGLCESAREDADQRLRDVLREWAGEDKASRYANHLYYRLDHRYSNKPFPPKAFIGRDAAVIASLSRVASDLKLELFLALLDRDGGSPTLDYLARSIVDIQSGHELNSYVPVDDNNLLQAGPSLQGTPSSGSETAVLIVPHDSLVDFVMQYIDKPANAASCSTRDQSLQGMVRYFVTRMEDSDGCAPFLPIFRDLCVQIWQMDGSKGLAILPEDTIQYLLKALVKAEDWSFLEQVASRLGNRTPAGFFTWVADQLASRSLPFSKLEPSLLIAATASTTLFDRLQIAWQLVSTEVPQRNCKELAQRLIVDLPEDLSSYHPCSALGHLLVDLTYLTQHDTEFLESKLTRIVERNAASTSFVLGVLDGLRSGPRPEHAISSIPKGLFERLARFCIDRLDVSKLFQRGQHVFRDRTCVCPGRLTGQPGAAGAIDALQLALTVFQLLADGAESVVASLACKIVADVALIPRQEFATLWLPFLGHLINVLEERKAPLSAARYRHLFAAILETYLARCVGPLPYKWTPKLRRAHCQCMICNQFTRFLSSSVSVARFGWLSYDAVGHINAILIYSAWDQYRCQFRVENGVLVVRKLYQVDPNVRKYWAENMEKANLNIDKLDGPALREILGDDYPRIRNFHLSHQMPQEAPPVPIESLDDPCEGSDQLMASLTSGPTTAGAPPSFAYQPRANQTFAHPDPTYPPLSERSNPISYASLNQPKPASGQAEMARAMRGLYSGCAIGPRPGPTQGFNSPSAFSLFCDDFRANLRRRGKSMGINTFYRKAGRQWRLMNEREQEPYILKARALHSSSGPDVCSSTLLNSSKEQPLGTPEPSPITATCMPQSTPSRGLSNAMLEHTKPGVGSGAPQPSMPVSTSRWQLASSASSSRVFGAPASSNRLNYSLPPTETHAQGKAETKMQTTVSMVGKPQAAVVIDLTGDE
ncbi:hypothetical protein VTH82DRAFT_2519 [Thermothelomyces myriococcoides]